MEQKKLHYETLFIINATLDEEATKAVVDKFTGIITENGELESVNEWGKRHLAYPIEDMEEGYYVLVRFFATSDFPAELDRRFNIDSSVLRSIIVKVEE